MITSIKSTSSRKLLGSNDKSHFSKQGGRNLFIKVVLVGGYLWYSVVVDGQQLVRKWTFKGGEFTAFWLVIKLLIYMCFFFQVSKDRWWLPTLATEVFGCQTCMQKEDNYVKSVWYSLYYSDFLKKSMWTIVIF